MTGHRAGSGPTGASPTTGGGDNVTLVAALTPDGPAFVASIRELLLPTLTPCQTLILDNLAVHKRATVRRLIEACGCRLLFLPPYSPDYNPIKLAFAKLKAALRRAAARMREDLDRAIAAALDTITAPESANWFRHCGYRPPGQPL